MAKIKNLYKILCRKKVYVPYSAGNYRSDDVYIVENLYRLQSYCVACNIRDAVVEEVFSYRVCNRHGYDAEVVVEVLQMQVCLHPEPLSKLKT